MVSDFLNNIIFLTDSYKVSHYKQMPPGTQYDYRYFESRAGAQFDETVFFGLQYLLKQYLVGHVVTKKKIDLAEELYYEHFGKSKVFNKPGWDYILRKHNGKLPVVIKAVAEGTVVGQSNVLFTIENTDPECYWLPGYLDSLLTQVWYTSTVATQSREMKKVLKKYLDETGDPNLIDFKLHDFGFRGVGCPEQAALGGAAHLVNFQGTDNVPALLLHREFYGERVSAFSIPAAEHSTVTAWGKDKEAEAYKHALEQFPSGTLAVVSDSYDVFNACENIWGGTLKDQVLARDGVLVVRPDSGNPVTTVCTVLNILSDKFGYTRNHQDYKVLNPKIRVIQGDGIDLDMLGNILYAMKCFEHFSADNVSFGSGGGLLQKVNRDTQRFAMKCSSVTVNSEERDVFKDPVTDQGKTSKRGRLRLGRCYVSNEFETYPAASGGVDYLQTVFRDGELLVDHKLSDIRKRAEP